MTGLAPLFAPLGDSAITVRLGDGVSDELSRTVFRSARRIAGARLDGVMDIVPAYAALTVFYSSSAVGYDEMRSRIAEVLEDASEMDAAIDGPAPAVVRVPVRYDGEDLDEVGSLTGLTRDGVIELHSSREYRVLVIGFVPGFAYLGTLDERLAVPRRESPRKRVAPGSVAIAELQTGVYPAATPGGWRIIGNTDLVVFDPHRAPPALLRVGDVVTFDPVDR